MDSICGAVDLSNQSIGSALLQRMIGGAPLHPSQRTELWSHANIGMARTVDQSVNADRQNSAPPAQRGDVAVFTTDTRLDNRDDLIMRLKGHFLVQENPSDGDLIVAAYACWGQDFPLHLHGAYALALWDGAKHKLFLLRDRTGERALYWCQARDTVLFASEPVQLLASGLIPVDYNREQILAHLLTAEAEPTATNFRSVWRLPEAHCLEVSSGTQRLRRYWHINSVQIRHWKRDEAVNALSEALHRAVARRVSATGETGILLSGGLDSCSIAACASTYLEQTNRQLHAFSWASQSGDSIDERDRSSLLIANRPNMVEHVVQADALPMLSCFPEAYANHNGPYSNAYPDLLWTTLSQARQCGFHVMLNGIGGDDVVGGRTPELALLLRGEWRTLSQRWRKTGFLRSNLVFQLRSAWKGQPPPDWLTLTSKKLAHTTGMDHIRVPFSSTVTPLAYRRHKLSRQGIARNREMAEQIGRRAGVRVLAPWHDVELASLVASLPDGGVDSAPPNKSLLREAMAGQLPDKLLRLTTEKSSSVQRPRLWSKPLQQNRHIIDDLLARPLLADLGLVETAAVRRLYSENLVQQQLSYTLSRLIATECWLRFASNNVKQFSPDMQ